jgi:hypothetical protein
MSTGELADWMQFSEKKIAGRLKRPMGDTPTYGLFRLELAVKAPGSEMRIPPRKTAGV